MLSYGDMKDFQRGLSGLLGPPALGHATDAMLVDHCSLPDVTEPFTAGNCNCAASRPCAPGPSAGLDLTRLDST